MITVKHLHWPEEADDDGGREITVRLRWVHDAKTGVTGLAIGDIELGYVTVYSDGWGMIRRMCDYGSQINIKFPTREAACAALMADAVEKLTGNGTARSG